MGDYYKINSNSRKEIDPIDLGTKGPNFKFQTNLSRIDPELGIQHFSVKLAGVCMEI